MRQTKDFLQGEERMNQIIISGRISKEISVKGKVGYFTLSNDRDYPFNKDQNGNKVTNFITCKVLGEKNIQRVQQYLTKGTAIIVTGHYYRDSWKASNEYKEFNYVLVEKWEFQTGKYTDDSSPVSNDDNSYMPDETHTPEENTQESSDSSDEGFMDIPDDVSLSDLPFRK